MGYNGVEYDLPVSYNIISAPYYMPQGQRLKIENGKINPSRIFWLK